MQNNKIIVLSVGFASVFFWYFSLNSLSSLPIHKNEIDSHNISPIKEPTVKSIHIIVALCDNKYQGIVPVGKVIGNGQDPFNNLYWGAAYGIKTYFKKSKEWKLLKSYTLNDTILERLVFKNTTKNIYLTADAYNGKYIQKATEDFLESSAGMKKDLYHFEKETIGIYGNAQLITFIGHDGLMDFKLPFSYQNVDSQTRDIIILACYSRHFFKPKLDAKYTRPIVWSTGLMAPEAYIIHDALSGWVQSESPAQISERAAQAYHRYQKCGINAARKLLISK